jgi:sugar phosphate isomerase/epimerase
MVRPTHCDPLPTRRPRRVLPWFALRRPRLLPAGTCFALVLGFVFSVGMPSWASASDSWLALDDAPSPEVRAEEEQAEEEARVLLPDSPLFGLCVGMHDARFHAPEAKAALMDELGFDGMAHLGMDDIPETLAALDRHGLKLFAVYAAINLDPDHPPHDPRMEELFRQLEGRETIVWLHTQGRHYETSSPKGDARAVEIIRHLSNRAARYDLRLSLYPHAGLWMERVDDALRVARKVGRKNVGVTFNLCHWLKAESDTPYEALLRRAMPRLSLVTINGADRQGRSWSELIRTLDQGDFDVAAFLRTLDELGYTGPVGLQCFGIKGDEWSNLAGSMDAWRRMTGHRPPGDDDDTPAPLPPPAHVTPRVDSSRAW